MRPTTLSKFDRLFITVSRLVDTLKSGQKCRHKFTFQQSAAVLLAHLIRIIRLWQGETTICKALVFWSPVAAVRTVLRSRSVLVNLMVSRKLSLSDGPEAAAKVRRYLENK